MVTRDEAFATAGLAYARILEERPAYAAREAEAAWIKHSVHTVDELKDRIRARRGLPPLDRTNLEQEGGCDLTE